MPETRWETYVEIVATVSPDKLLVRLVRILDEAGYKLVDVDEEARRVMFKAPLTSGAGLASLLEWFSSGSFEAKLGRSVIQVDLRRAARALRSRGYSVETYRNRLLLFKAGEGFSFLGELKPGKLLGKYCKETLSARISPFEVPPSLCSYSLEVLRSPEFLEEARLRLMNLYRDIVEILESLDT